MKMTRFEKRFVNRKKKAERNIEKVRRSLQQIEMNDIKNVLELGCGTGVVSAFLADSYKLNVQATDFDPEQIEIAREMNLENKLIQFRVEDATHLSFVDGTFDLVVSHNVFHHVPDWRSAVREIARVLRPQGYFEWYDLAFPKLFKKLFQPFVKNYGLYVFEEIMSAFSNHKLISLFYEQDRHGLLVHHHMLLQKNQNWNNKPDSLRSLKSYG